MDQVSAQTEKIATYETSRTRRSLVDGNMHSDDSNNDEEYETSGFYVREKTSDKKPNKNIAPEETSKVVTDVQNCLLSDFDSGNKKNDNAIKENGNCVEKDPSSPEVNGENSKDSEPSSENKDVATEPDKQELNDENPREEENEDSKTEPNSGNKTNVIDPEENLLNGDDSKEGETSAETKTESLNDEAASEIKSNQKDLEKDEIEEPIAISENKVTTIDSEKEECKEPEAASENKTSNIEDDSAKKEKEEQIIASASKANNIDTEKEESEEPIIATSENKPSNTDSGKEEANESNAIEGKSEENDISTTINKEIDSSTTNEENDLSSTAKLNEDNPCPELQNKNETKESAKRDEVIEIIEENKNDRDEVIEIIEDHKNAKTDEVIEIIDVEPSKETSIENTTEDKVIEYEGSILKEHLEKPPSIDEDINDHDEDMDEDFDPSLLCPDISMDIDEAPVMTSIDHTADDGSTSPLPYEPIFSTLVDEITGAEVHVDLTPEEMELRKRMYGPNNLVQETKVHCTACNVHLGSALIGANNRFVHPLLKVLICKNCYHFYTSGEFEKDEDGSELYCRWCGQGGQVLCCSSCEFVFCKRCIRNNFGPKKFKEIRDSDDWNCFRCNPEQLSNLRASCAEFMDYYRTELARAQTLADTKPELMTTDYTKCCGNAPDKKEEGKAPLSQKTRKKRKDDEDPDYRPVLDDGEPPAKKSVPAGGPGYSVIPPASLRQIVPKTINTPTTIRQVGSQPLRTQVTTTGQVFRMGNTTFRAKTVGTTSFAIQRPNLQQGQKINPAGLTALPLKTVSKTTTPGYIKILPQRLTGPRPSSSYTVVSGTNNGKPTFSTVRPIKSSPMPQMKHEWFEKTVRAAARVNSNLSYTLTQLNRQQSQAGSVEALAMVHNKLQEVLSTSINSLIQIRKNLRTEFIAGIKNIKFPPKAIPVPPTATSIVVKDDDDVIFINPAATSASQPPPLVLSPNVTLAKKSAVQKTTTSNFPKPSTSGLKSNISKANKTEVTTTATAIAGPIRGGFLKVRSLTSLQTVPSECITIPDDPPVAPPIEKDPLSLADDDPLNMNETIIIEPEIAKPKVSSKAKVTRRSKDSRRQMKEPEVSSASPTFTTNQTVVVYNVKDKPSPDIKKMMGAFVAVKRSPYIDKLLLTQGLSTENSDTRKRETKVREVNSESHNAS